MRRKHKPDAVAAAQERISALLGLKPLTADEIKNYPAAEAKPFTDADSDALRNIALTIRILERTGCDHKKVRDLKFDLRYRLVVDHGKPEGYAWPDVHVSFGDDPAVFQELPKVIVT